MRYIKGENRYQPQLMPDCIEDYVREDNPVRIIDAFVDGLNMAVLGFKHSELRETGRPSYDPHDLLKLYLYGYFNKIRSSRKLMLECSRNVELFWLLGKVCPDFRTIADFRKDNAKAIPEVFRSFVRLCVKLGLYQKKVMAVDGSKFRAQNSDDKCYNAEILRRKLANIDEHITQYLLSMDKIDQDELDDTLTAEQVQAVFNELRARKDKYEGYLRWLDESGETQILETDTEAHRMRTKDGFHCCYNVQTAVDAGSHLIAGYEVTNHNTDQGLLNQVCEHAKELLGVETIEVVADKGYESRHDILDCLMNGTVPNVAMKYDKTERVFNLEFAEEAITEEVRSSSKAEDIHKCLHAGVLPKCYENTAVTVEIQELSALSCFVKNADGTVTCPMGKQLTLLKMRGQNSIYGSKEACRTCNNRCTSSKNMKTVSFGPDTDCVPVRMYGKAKKVQQIPEGARISSYNHSLDRKDYTAKRKVVIRIREDKGKLKQRMCLSEHPFGTVKWYHGANYLLCRGKEKASAEIGLSFLAYNLRRAINMVGVKRLIEAMV